MVATLLKFQPKPQLTQTSFWKEWSDIIIGKTAGTLGQYEYNDSSMAIWNKFLKDNADVYYAPGNEPVVIKRGIPVSAEIIGNGPVTLVSRGCGTKFFAKEGLLKPYLKNIAKVIYMDRTENALDQSEYEGRKLFPDAIHKRICHDIFDPALRYDVIGTEVNVLFGLTLNNVSGFVQDGPPQKDYQDKIKAMKEQMSQGAHFLVTGDTNQDKESNEAAYRGQIAFALSMLRRNGISIPFDFEVEYHPESYLLAHYFVSDQVWPVNIPTLYGDIRYHRKKRIHFNSSGKFPADVQIKWTEDAGLKSHFRPEETMKDHQGRIAWFHFQK